MIYLDYAANTPVHEEVLKTFCDISREYIANPNSTHLLGRQAKERLDEATQNIARLLGAESSDIIYTSGATESNNLAIKGIASKYKKHGKHIITSYLEHSSVTSVVSALQTQGYEIDFVDILDNGLIDLDHLKELLREDTILVSIGHIDSELGIIQPIDTIGQLLADYPHCFFHVDATQSIGKFPVDLTLIDLVSFAPHKFFGLNGIGVLVKKQDVLLDIQIHGGVSTTVYRSGSPILTSAVTTETALALADAVKDTHYEYIKTLNTKIRKGLAVYPLVHINSSDYASPYILNFSIKGIKSHVFQQSLEEEGICISTKSACCTINTPSRPVYAITKDRKLALSALRISLSHLTTDEEISVFLECFEKCYKKLMK